MNSYLNDPNTRRLATRCCMCGRSLRDAKSVEIGIGPVCRSRGEFGTLYDALTPRKQKNVNRLIHAAGVACEDNDPKEVLALADKIEKRGFTQVAEKVRSRFIKIRIHRATVPEFGWSRDRGEFSLDRDHDVVQVWTPYSDDFNANRRSNRLRGRPVKEVTGFGKFHWEFKVGDSLLLMRVLAQTFPGLAFVSDKGIAMVPTAKEFNDTYAGGSVQSL